jgi:hypothetical protein
LGPLALFVVEDTVPLLATTIVIGAGTPQLLSGLKLPTYLPTNAAGIARVSAIKMFLLARMGKVSVWAGTAGTSLLLLAEAAKGMKLNVRKIKRKGFMRLLNYLIFVEFIRANVCL